MIQNVEYPDQKATGEDAPSAAKIDGPANGLLGSAIRDLVFFGLFAVYLWQAVGLHLIFHGAGLITNFPSFYTTWAFFQEHLFVPGGPVEYIAAFLSQLFYYPWLGALAIAIQAWLLGLCLAYLWRATGSKDNRYVRYIPALLLAVLYGQYTYFLPTTMALLIALLLACAYVGLAQHRPFGPSLVAFILLSVACYYTTGGAFLLFASACIIYEVISLGRHRLGIVYALTATGLPFVIGGLAFDMAEPYTQSLPISWTLLSYESRARAIEWVDALYLLTPVLMVTGGLWPQVSNWRQKRKKRDSAKAKRRSQAAANRAKCRPRLRGAAETIGATGILLAVAFGSLDTEQKNRFAVDYYATHGMWSKVLAAGRQPSDDPVVMHAVDRALCRTGRLGDEMFQWPQRPEYLFLTGSNSKRTFWATFPLYMDLGLLNAAEHALTECLEGLGDRPMVLKSLALINLAKGNLGTARVYLGALNQTLFHRSWARHYLTLLDTDPNLETDSEVQRLQSVALEQDYTFVAPPSGQMLEKLHQKNAKNRMAFEYLIASLLLNKELATFAQHIGQFEQVGYTTLPKHFEEAALTYVYGTRQPLSFGRYKPRDDLRQQTEAFLKTLTRYRGDRQAALAELQPYRHTYLFYYTYTQVN